VRDLSIAGQVLCVDYRWRVLAQVTAVPVWTGPDPLRTSPP
jgi:hypothetical protein